MSDSTTSTSDSHSAETADQSAGRNRRTAAGGGIGGGGDITLAVDLPRNWHDVFWLVVFALHLIGLGFCLTLLGLNRFKKSDRFNIDRFTNQVTKARGDLTEDYWPMYAVGCGVGAVLGWTWLLLLDSRAYQIMKFAVHILTTYLAVISVLCFWCKAFFWGVAFAVGGAVQFLYVISVIERLPFTMLVLKKAVKMVWSLPEVLRVSFAFTLVMLLWMAVWSFGAAGIVASSYDEVVRWWLLLGLSVSLFWTGAVLCNTVHVIVSGMVFLVLMHGGREATSMPPNPVRRSVRYAVTTSFGSICYGSLFTAAIRTLRWEIRGLRSKIGKNECLLCCVDFLFHLVETLVRFFNKYAYVQIGVYGKNFNHSARDAWELFQSTGVEALVAYDCSGAVILMGTLLGGLISGTCAGVWTHIKWNHNEVMVGSTSVLMGAFLVGLAMVVVESAATSIYICYAEDPLLIHRWDPEFFNQLSETLHERLQYRSSRARELLGSNRFDAQTMEVMAT